MNDLVIRINGLKIGIEDKDCLGTLDKLVRKKLRTDSIDSVKIVKESIDARHKPEIFRVYTVDVSVHNPEKTLAKSKCRNAVIYKRPEYVWPEGGPSEYRPVIIGMGPAGLFCGYMLAMAGCRPIICDRGKCIEDRRKDVSRFWETGALDTESNVQFGEGGAGTFSDGKLNTLVNDKNGRNGKVLEIFVQNGAPEEILYKSKPHIGTDVLADVVVSMREHIIQKGGEFKYGCKLVSVENSGQLSKAVFEDGSKIITDSLVLAIGHSARDTFRVLHESGVPMSNKAFAVGLRVIHPQKMINEAMYGLNTAAEIIGAAPYKLTYKASSGRGVYSFCNCPGGYVVNASSEEGRTAVNGMSYSKRDGDYANSGIIVTVTPDDYGSDDVLAGMEFQRELEAKAYRLGQGDIPVQSYPAYRDRYVDETDPEYDAFKGRIRFTDMSDLLPGELRDAFIEGMEGFDKVIPGFASNKALLAGIESRTSSPVRIERGNDGRSTYGAVYPCGEGAGYAGGITSAAMDGIYIAEEIWKKHLTR